MMNILKDLIAAIESDDPAFASSKIVTHWISLDKESQEKIKEKISEKGESYINIMHDFISIVNEVLADEILREMMGRKGIPSIIINEIEYNSAKELIEKATTDEEFAKIFVAKVLGQSEENLKIWAEEFEKNSDKIKEIIGDSMFGNPNEETNENTQIKAILGQLKTVNEMLLSEDSEKILNEINETICLSSDAIEEIIKTTGISLVSMKTVIKDNYSLENNKIEAEILASFSKELILAGMTDENLISSLVIEKYNGMKYNGMKYNGMKSSMSQAMTPTIQSVKGIKNDK